MKSILLGVLCLFTASQHALASGDEQFKKHFNQTGGVAVHGYDLVSYFSGAPLQGIANFEVVFNDVVFQFATQANADEFDSNPEKYLPAYGGWCATAIGMMSKKLDITQTSYLIQDGVLYLFSTSMGPARDQWIAGQPALKDKADKNWAKIYAN